MKFIPARLRRLFSLPVFPLWLGALVLLAPVYLTGKALFWGTPLLQFGPWWSYSWRTLLSGHLPLWNPLLGMGAPLMANYQSALFYPPNWLYLALYALGGAPRMAWGMAPVAALHLVWAGLGMAGVVRRMGLGVLAQTVSGLAFSLSGYLIARLGFLSITSTVAWLPWVLLYLTPLKNNPGARRRDYLKLAACLAFLLLAGHAQTAWYTLVLAGLWAGFWAGFSLERPTEGAPVAERLPRFKRVRQVIETWSWLGLALALAAGICAVQLIPTGEYLAQSQRAAAVDYEYALNYSFWPWHLLTAFTPGLFGSPASADYWGASNYWEDAFYIGLLPLLLASGALASSLHRKQGTAGTPWRSLAWFLIGLMGISLVFALGKHTPVFPWLYRHVPTFAMFQAPTRWLIWSVFALALLAGIGAERWRQPQGWGLYWARLWTMGALAITIGAGLAWFVMGDISPTFVRATALMGFFGLGIGMLSLAAPPPAQVSAAPPGIANQNGRGKARNRLIQFAPPESKPRDPNKPYRLGIWQAAVVAWVSLDLLAAGWGLNPGETPALYAPSAVASRIRLQAQDGRLYLSKKQEDWLKYERFLRFDTFYPGEDWQNLRAVVLPDTNLLDGIRSVNNFDPLMPGRYTDWLEMLEQASPAVYGRMLRLMGVGVIEIWDSQGPSGVQYLSYDGIRTRWAQCAWSASDANQARRLVLTDQVDFEREVVLEGLEAPLEANCPDNGLDSRPVALQLLSEQDPNRIEIRVNTPRAGWVVISDVWYPGWSAWVDGEPVPLLRANYLFRAVGAPAGEHQVVLVYQPLSFWGGAILSLVSLLAVGVICVRRRRTIRVSNPDKA